MWSFLYQGFSAGSCPIHHRIETRFCSVVSSARPGNPAPELFRQAKARFLAFLLHSWRIEKRMIAKSEHWNLSKVTKLVLCQLIAMGVCLVVTLHYSPASETLLQVNRERLLFYAATLGVFFLLAGEVSGLFVDQRRSGAWKRVFLTLVSSGLGVLGLIILVWTIEFDFVGRFAAFKMLSGVALLVYLFLALQGFLSQGNPLENPGFGIRRTKGADSGLPRVRKCRCRLGGAG